MTPQLGKGGETKTGTQALSQRQQRRLDLLPHYHWHYAKLLLSHVSWQRVVHQCFRVQSLQIVYP